MDIFPTQREMCGNGIPKLKKESSKKGRGKQKAEEASMVTAPPRGRKISKNPTPLPAMQRTGFTHRVP
jgi:hypothetical protein